MFSDFRRKIFLITLIAASAAYISCSGSSEPAKTGVPKITVKSGIDSESGILRLQLTVPPGHHAYTDAGDSGNLIPVSFLWEKLHEENGITGPVPSLVGEMPGTRDEEYQAKVLRGSAVFEFKAEDVRRYAGRILHVRSQICDEKTGICYRPETVQVSIAN